MVPGAESPSPHRAVALVPVEQLQDAGGLAERAHALLQFGRVDGVDQPHTAVDGERVRRPLQPLVAGPAEATVPLVDQARSHVLHDHIDQRLAVRL